MSDDFRESPEYRDLLNRFVDMLEAERATQWTRGDIVAEMLRRFSGNKKARKVIIGDLADTARCCAETIRQYVRVAVAFPHDHRYPDFDWSWYREVYLAAKRGGREPLDLLPECVRETPEHRMEPSLSAAELRLLYKDPSAKPPVLRFAATCKICGRRTIEYVGPEDAGEVIKCRKCREVLGKVE